MIRPILITAVLSVASAGSAQSQTVREWFRMAPCGQQVSLQPTDSRRVTVDDANGYLQVSDIEGDLGHETTFAIFRKADGSRIFACSELERSDDGTGTHLTFYELRGGRLVAITRPVVPRMDLVDFLAPGTTPPARKYRRVLLHYILPRRGTTIRVQAEELDADEAFADPRAPNGMWPEAEIQRYWRIVGSRRYRAIELNWDRTRGVFTAGRKIPR
ncbi:MAG TPA: hypothetical protein VFS20_08475 [Longimicrobium sp.]|nr:hypothetical protein [Longimicrobium sp.]